MDARINLDKTDTGENAAAADNSASEVALPTSSQDADVGELTPEQELEIKKIKMELAIDTLKFKIKSIQRYSQAGNLLFAMAQSLEEFQVKSSRITSSLYAVTRELYLASSLLGNQFSKSRLTSLGRADTDVEQDTKEHFKKIHQSLEKVLRKFGGLEISDEKPSLEKIPEYLLEKLDEYLVQIEALVGDKSPLVVSYLFFIIAQGIGGNAFFGKGFLTLFSPTNDPHNLNYAKLIERAEFMQHAMDLGHPDAIRWFQIHNERISAAWQHTISFATPSTHPPQLG